MESVNEILLKLIANEACGADFAIPENILSDSFLLNLHFKAKRHGVANILSSSLINSGVLDNRPIKSFYENEVFSAIFINEKMNTSLKKISEAFEKEKIPHIPLKGAVIRAFYPEPWLRSSCDIDILVKPDDLDKAADVISAENFVKISDSEHDVVFKSTDGVIIELHFKLLNDKKSPFYSDYLENIWDYAAPVGVDGYLYSLNDSMFYYYHIVHMAKHFIHGGCGLRPFLDLWLMNKNKNYDTAELNKMLKKGRLWDFNVNVKRLSEIWFSGEGHDETTLIMEKYILDGGSFGSKETRIVSGTQRHGGKSKFVLSRIFVPFDYLKRCYPILKKYPFLAPLCEICRLLSLLFGKKRKFRKNRFNDINNVSQEHIDDINLLFERVGLN